MKTTEEVRQVNVRMPAELSRAAKMQAAELDVSLQDFCVIALARFVEVPTEKKRKLLRSAHLCNAI